MGKINTHALAGNNHDHHIHHRNEADSVDVFGFWLYIMTDCILFGSLFATFAVLYNMSTFGPSLREHIHLSYVLVETFCLLGSNFTFGMGIISMYKNKINLFKLWLFLTFVLGACFVGMELNEFFTLWHEGLTWHVSGALSAFYVLVGTHGLHVSIGLIWILIMILQVSMYGFTSVTKKRLTYLGLFWNFLEIVWIFVFTIVYLLGAM